jgi:hypothetical protein
MMIGMISEGHVWDLGSLILIMSFSWIPILNPLMTILFISAYRKALSRLIYAIFLHKTEVQIITSTRASNIISKK